MISNHNFKRKRGEKYLREEDKNISMGMALDSRLEVKDTTRIRDSVTFELYITTVYTFFV